MIAPDIGEQVATLPEVHKAHAVAPFDQDPTSQLRHFAVPPAE